MFPTSSRLAILGAAAFVLLSVEIGSTQGMWRIGPSMKVARSEIDAALLGNQIYVAGGIGFFRVLRSCEVYSLLTEKWDRCQPLPKVLHHVALTSARGRVFASGGYNSLGFEHDPDPKLYSLEPDGSEWSVLADLPEPLGEHAFVTFNDALYVIGGRAVTGATSRVWEFDLDDFTWTEMTSMPTPRHSTATIVIDGKIWVLGGRSEELGAAIDRVEVFDPIDNTWRVETPMPVGRGGHAAAERDGFIHVFGGELFDPDKVLDRHDVYDMTKKTWSTALVPPEPRHGGVAVSAGSDIYVIAGGSRPALQTIFSVTGTLQVLQLAD